MKKSIIAILSMVLVVGILIRGTVVNAQTTNTQEVNKNEITNNVEQETIDKLNEMYEKVNSGELTYDEQKEVISELKEIMPELIEANLPKVGDGVEEVCNYIELQKANAEMEEFQKYLDTIDTTKYMPMSEEELNNLLND